MFPLLSFAIGRAGGLLLSNLPSPYRPASRPIAMVKFAARSPTDWPGGEGVPASCAGPTTDMDTTVVGARHTRPPNFPTRVSCVCGPQTIVPVQVLRITISVIDLNNVRNRLARVVLDFFGDRIVRHHETTTYVADGVHEKARDACSEWRHGNQVIVLVATLIVDDERFTLASRTCAWIRKIFGVRDPDRPPVRPNALHHGQDVGRGCGLVVAVSAVRDKERNDSPGIHCVYVDHQTGSRTAARRSKSDLVTCTTGD